MTKPMRLHNDNAEMNDDLARRTITGRLPSVPPSFDQAVAEYHVAVFRKGNARCDADIRLHDAEIAASMRLLWTPATTAEQSLKLLEIAHRRIVEVGVSDRLGCAFLAAALETLRTAVEPKLVAHPQ